MNIILINSQDISRLYGIGAYVTNLRDELAKHKNLNIIYVEIEYGESGHVKVIANTKYKHILIRLKHRSGSDVDSAKACVIFHTILLNSNVKDGIIHINTPMDLEICKIGREHLFKIILTQHVDFHQVVTQNNKNSTSFEIKLIETYRELFTLIDGCIFLTDDTRQKAFHWLNFPSNKSTVIYNGIKWRKNRTSRKKIKKRLGFVHDEFITLFVGRLEKSKGIYELIEAFKIFSNNDPKKKLVLIGTGDYEEIMKLTSGNINNFLFAGFLNKNDISDFYKIADLGVLPSYTEQSSLAVIEMVHNDIPLILSDISGFKMFKENEVIKIPINQSIYGARVNIRSLSDSLDLLYKNKNLRKELTLNNSHHKRLSMDIKVSVDKTVNFYHSIMLDKTNL